MPYWQHTKSGALLSDGGHCAPWVSLGGHFRRDLIRTTYMLCRVWLSLIITQCNGTSVEDVIIPLSLWITGHPPQEDWATKEWGEGSRIDSHLEEEPRGDWHLFPQRQEVYRWGTDFNCRPGVPGWDHAVLDSRAGYLQGEAKHWALDGGLPEGAGTTLW